MAKQRISASVDPDVQEYLSEEAVNASGLINQLIKQQMSVTTTSRKLRCTKCECDVKLRRKESGTLNVSCLCETRSVKVAEALPEVWL